MTETLNRFRRWSVDHTRLLLFCHFICILLILSGCVDEGSSSNELNSPTYGSKSDSIRADDQPFVSERAKMVTILKSILENEGTTIFTQKVLEILGRVPRHEFVPQSIRSRAYEVRSPLPIAENQTISSPEFVAIMTTALELKGTEKVLEIGTGSGYQAAVLGELVPEVYTVEIRPGLAETARKRLEKLKGEKKLNFKKIEVIIGDGNKGHAAEAPYDGIIVTAAPAEVPTTLLNQLKIGGRMVIPVGEFYQKLQIIERKEDDSLETKIIQPVRFVPMIEEGES